MNATDPAHGAVQAIVRGMEAYFRTFALAEGMAHHPGEIEWIAPSPGAAGPAIVFRVALDVPALAARLTALVAAIRAGKVPALWVLTPATPAGVAERLVAAGFCGDLHPAESEPGMALDTRTWEQTREEASRADRPALPGLVIRRVTTPGEFAAWANVANEALHGWRLITPEGYASWLRHAPYTFYLACVDGTAVATLATLRDDGPGQGGAASLEFVGTLASHRGQGIATSLCTHAIEDLRAAGVRLVTLRAHAQAAPLYERLGFRRFYDQVLLEYPLPG